MEIGILKNDKENLLIELENQTLAEILRVYLNKDSNVELAAWKRVNPSKPVVLEIRTKGKTAKKALDDAVVLIEKESNKYLDEFKKAK